MQKIAQHIGQPHKGTKLQLCDVIKKYISNKKKSNTKNTIVDNQGVFVIRGVPCENMTYEEIKKEFVGEIPKSKGRGRPSKSFLCEQLRKRHMNVSVFK